ncbi:MAG: hypothetical protein HeimC3_32860 [Candidatus Heimdallarchaeota archaeon LC_3]|nr:MAG: hypothetical protein HeimC3_32860 [Candidatus Heimdallarchaeota archaeon LC_3]
MISNQEFSLGILGFIIFILYLFFPFGQYLDISFENLLLIWFVALPMILFFDRIRFRLSSGG